MNGPTRGERIRSAREALGLSQRETAARVPVSERTLRDWEADRTNPMPENLTRLADVLGISLADIDGINE